MSRMMQPFSGPLATLQCDCAKTPQRLGLDARLRVDTLGFLVDTLSFQYYTLGFRVNTLSFRVDTPMAFNIRWTL